jgi:hypothetical protein
MATQENLDKVKNSREDKNKKKARQWQKPTLEDVSEKIMAQPYIRFT